MPSDHVGLEHYEWVKSGRMQPGELLRLIHRHVLAGCEECRREWRELVEGEHADLWEMLVGEPGELPFDVPLSPAAARAERPAPYASAFTALDRKITAAETSLKRDRTRARKELAALLALPAAERLGALRRSRQRFRSPAFAHLLLDDARTRVRHSPHEALAVLDLVWPTVERIPGALAYEWARALAVRAEAHRANALRVTGDLHAADRHFREVRRRLAAAGVDDPAVEAEVASLEASLRRDQRRYDEAALLLDRAVLIYETVREAEGLARVLIKRAEVGQYFERSGTALADLERARELLDPERQPFLYLCTVIGAVPTLLDRGRYLEAERILARAEDTVAAAEPWWRLRFRFLAGRAAFGLGDLDRAATLLDEARQGFLARDLPCDAAIAALELALVSLRQGRTAEVRELAGQIAPILQHHGVDREVLATLALFGQSVHADAAALALAAELRRHVEAARSVSAVRTPREHPPS